MVLTEGLGQHKAKLQPNVGCIQEVIPVCVISRRNNGTTASPHTFLCRADKASFKNSHRRFNGLVTLESLAFVAAISKQVQPSPAATDFQRSSVCTIGGNENKDQKGQLQEEKEIRRERDRPRKQMNFSQVITRLKLRNGA